MYSDKPTDMVDDLTVDDNEMDEGATLGDDDDPEEDAPSPKNDPVPEGEGG